MARPSMRISGERAYWGSTQLLDLADEHKVGDTPTHRLAIRTIVTLYVIFQGIGQLVPTLRYADIRFTLARIIGGARHDISNNRMSLVVFQPILWRRHEPSHFTSASPASDSNANAQTGCHNSSRESVMQRRFDSPAPKE